MVLLWQKLNYYAASFFVFRDSVFNLSCWYCQNIYD